MTINFETACSRAFKALSTIESVRILTEHEKRRLSLDLSGQVWSIDTEISLLNECCLINFYLWLNLDFPYGLPSIFLSPSDFNKVKYIPHIDEENLVCTFDRDLTTTNPELPEQIVIDVLRKAKQIISDGFAKKNLSEFNEEFLSYWRLKYEDEPPVNRKILSFIESNELKGSKILCLKKKFNSFEYIIHNNSDTIKNFKIYLSKIGCIYEEIIPFVLDDFKLPEYPPFQIRHNDVLQYLNQHPSLFPLFRNYYNSSSLPKIILFSIDGFMEIFGWIHKTVTIKIDGFRQNSKNAFTIFSIYEKNKLVNRISPETYSKKFLVAHSLGNINQKEKYTFCVIGVGSIGSHLIHFLNSINTPNFKLIDNDILNVRNAGRHLLGIDSVGLFKSKEIKRILNDKSPDQNIITREKSVIEVFHNEVKFINNIDYFFDCTGKTNINLWLSEQIDTNKITTPVFFLWVEPYLLGGHCLYIHPNDREYLSFFEPNGLFKYNLIDRSEYECNNQILTIKEARCNTSYTPYGLSDIMLFLSSVYPKIYSIIQNGIKKSSSFSWVGDNSIFNSLNLKRSSVSAEWQNYTLVEHKYD